MLGVALVSNKQPPSRWLAILPLLTALAMVRSFAYPGLAGRLFAGTVLIVSLALAVTTLWPRKRP